MCAKMSMQIRCACWLLLVLYWRHVDFRKIKISDCRVRGVRLRGAPERALVSTLGLCLSVRTTQLAARHHTCCATDLGPGLDPHYGSTC